MNKVVDLVLMCLIFLHASSFAVDRSQLGSDIDGGAEDDNSGWSVSLSSAGDRVAIGSPYYSIKKYTYEGRVRVYDYSGTDWVQLGSDIDGVDSGENCGWSVSLSSAGDRVAIGSPSETYWNEYGYVRIYEFSGGGWNQLGADIDGTGSYDVFGHSVSLSSAGDRVAIGAPYNGGNGANAGQARIYEYSGGSWSPLGSDIEGEAAGDQCGYSVSLSAAGDRVAIGARNKNSVNGSETGQVRVYEYSDSEGDWVKLGSDIDGVAAANRFGASVSLSAAGDRVAIGAPRNDAGGDSAGQVRIYEYSPAVTNWIQLGSNINGKAAEELCGLSASLSDSGDRVAVGAPDGSINTAGHVRIYEFSGGDWVQLALDIDGEDPGDTSGASVSLSSTGDRLAIGAPYNDGSGNNAGQVRIYGNNVVDTDGDGLCDALEAYYSTDLEDVDTDDDGYTDSAEVVMGFSPTNPLSTLDLSGWSTNGYYQLGFATASNRLFHVESKASLMQSNWIERIGISGTGHATNWIEPSLDSNQFYRIKVHLQ